jgi:enoyl-CoA hydratase/carnithine racemase
MAGTVTLQDADAAGIARVTLGNPGKLNAVDIGMWQALRTVFTGLQTVPAPRAPRVVIVAGADGQFASGGDIAEFAQFRFDEARLRHFHEEVVAPALQALLDCDIPLLAQIDGACIGAGLEIAACCDIRLCGQSSRFGAPIAKLGFPMAPQELQVVGRIATAPVLREMLLEARLFDAVAALHHGLVHTVAADADVAAQAQRRAAHIATLSPQAARINKRSLRQSAAGGPAHEERHAHFAYADSAEHREGVMAFIEKRPPRFQRG